MKAPWFLLSPALLLSVAAQTAEFPSLRWLHPGADPVQHLAAAPAECLDLSAPADTLARIETGRQLFRNPFVLGERNARAGMSCQTCHRNGHGHPGFYREGLSGAPGTVDMSAAPFGQTREDGIFNPLAIPSLVDVLQRASLGTRRPRESLAAYVEQHIVEELQGPEPSSEVVDALSAYQRALSSSACPAQTELPLSLEEDYYEITRTINVLYLYFEEKNEGIADLLFLSVQRYLEEMQRRFGASATALAEAIAEHDARLGEVRATALAGDGEGARRELRAWHASWRRLLPALREAEKDSLYNREKLERWLREGRGG